MLPNTKYYARAYAANNASVGCGQQVTFTTYAHSGIYIGAHYGGGIIVYIDGTGKHGLIAATADQSDSATWWNGAAFSPDSATSTALGSGAANTTYIIDGQGPGVYAASLCRNYTGGGYTDWYLPSYDELNAIFNVNYYAGTSLASNVFYWTSTALWTNETINASSYALGYSTQEGLLPSGQLQSQKLRVRAIRSL